MFTHFKKCILLFSFLCQILKSILKRKDMINKSVLLFSPMAVQDMKQCYQLASYPNALNV